MVHQWGFFGSISAIRKIWSLTASSRSLQAAALKTVNIPQWASTVGLVKVSYATLNLMVKQDVLACE